MPNVSAKPLFSELLARPRSEWTSLAPMAIPLTDAEARHVRHFLIAAERAGWPVLHVVHHELGVITVHTAPPIARQESLT